MKSVAHPSGVPILFDAKWHQYKMGGVSLRSVSKVLDRFFPFDEKGVLALVSRKTGEPVAVIKEKWNRQALLGKNVHQYIESKLLQAPAPTFCLLLEKAKKDPGAVKDLLHGEESLYLPVADQAVQTMLESYEVLAVEQVIACPSLGIAGTIDLLARNKKNGHILIGDWKTSGSVKSNFRFGSFESSSLGCLRHLPNSKMYRYALQIAIYGEILRREGYLESGYFDKLATNRQVTAAPGKAGKAARQKKEKKAPSPASPSAISMEYGLVYMSKEETGDVASEFIGISENTILPKDRPEMTFSLLLQQVLEGKV
eukprot:gene4032-2886_t